MLPSTDPEHRGVGNGEWGVGERSSFADLPLPTPDLPIPDFTRARRMEIIQ
jgi:hypothetical protein